MSYDVDVVRKDFPILSRILPNGRPLVYLDSANTSQKPQQVIDAERDYYEQHNANVHRAIHTLGAEATEAYEGARAKVARFLGGADEREIVFAKNSTEALNLVARVLGDAGRVGPGDEVRDHRDGAPLQHRAVAAALRAHRRHAALDRADRRRPARPRRPRRADQRANRRSSRSSTCPTSSAPSTRSRPSYAGPGRSVRWSMLDASQSVPHLPVDVQALGVDLVAFTGHKMVGPTGIGVLWGRYELLEALPPFLGGGEMIEEVAMAGSTFALPPAPVRGRHAADRAGRRPGRRRRLPDRPRHGRDRRARARADGVPAGRLEHGRRAADHRPGDDGRPRRDRVVHARPASTRTTSGRCSTSRASRSGWGITAPDRCACATASRRPRGPRCTCTRRRLRSTRWSAGLEHVEAVLRMTAGPSWSRCTRRSSWTTTAPASQGPARAVRGAGAPRQPDLRRRDHAAGAPRRRRRRRRVLRRRGLLDLAGIGQRDDRSGDRQDGAGRRSRCTRSSCG